MALYEASLRVRHECPYREISERHPDLTIREWPLSDCQVLEISADETPTDRLMEDIDRLGTVLHESADDAGYHVVTQSCLCSLEESIVDRFEEYNCLYQSPTIYRQGWEHYTVIAFDEATSGRCSTICVPTGTSNSSRKPPSPRSRSHTAC